MFTRSAAIYDAIYGQRFDGVGAARRIEELIQAHTASAGKTVLDVACGTGICLSHLRVRYWVEGLDLDAGMLAVARQKLPDVPLHQADLIDFDLGRRFDAVLCLGSSIGYVETRERLNRAIATLARQAAEGGVVIVEPWFSPEVWESGRITADLVDEPALKIARIQVSGREANVSTLDIHYLVGRPEGVETFAEHHRMGLFTHEEYLGAFRGAHLTVTHDPVGLLGRGLYIGVRLADARPKSSLG